MSSFRDSKRYGAIRSEDVHSFISSVNFEKKEFKSYITCGNKPYRHMDAWLLMACFNLVDIAQMSSGFNRDNPL